ncbi:CRISPR-associated protein Csx10 [Anoxybacillus tepidamans]|uniref:CRISPR-associated protein Csx10 n=1 Tax=Anoxybacteroides tepidamans TaxID=265948 RepID=A0A7W8MVP9_9BACL|nr:RAMP superfamily CRISPR-associated protein [Anoxybacillus tepidamans]MBB5325138.1 CRISPR-associated protein Csx10 [Anoxybacillus tepidamans]
MAGIYDADIHFDSYGIPFIPAKRIKGCLKEAALELMDVDHSIQRATFEKLFGLPGTKDSIVKIGNGYIDNYEKIIQELKKLIESQYKKYAHPLLIQSYFTTARIQTSIDPTSHTVKDHSLRTTRLIKSGLMFYFDVHFDEFDRDCIELLEKSCKLLRRIGLNRTRGWGEVACNLERDGHVPTDNQYVGEASSSNNEHTVLVYELKLKSPLFVSMEVGNSSMSNTHITGGQILGALASNYLKKQKLTGDQAHEDERFRELFLSDSVKYLHAYPVTKDNRRSFPIPLSIVQQKDEEKIYDLANDDNYEEVLEEEIQTKKIDGYAYLEDGNIELVKVDTEVYYHHRRPQDRTIGHATNEDGQFYQIEVIKKGQVFQGLIIGESKWLSYLKEMICDTPVIRLGRSKTAQYAEAEIKLIEPSYVEEIDCEQYIYPGDQVVVTLTSPMILFDEDEGIIKTDPKGIVEMFSKKYPSFSYKRSFIRTKRISGFNGKWKMSKQQVDAIDAGSVIVMTYEGEEEICTSDIVRESYGLRTNEGFGRLVINRHGQCAIGVSDNRSNSEKKTKNAYRYIQPMLDHILKERVYFIVRRFALDVIRTENQWASMSHSLIFKLIDMLNVSSCVEEFTRLAENVKGDLPRFMLETEQSANSVADKVKNKVEKVKRKVLSDEDWNLKMSKIASGDLKKWIETQPFDLYKYFVLTTLQYIKWSNRQKKG